MLTRIHQTLGKLPPWVIAAGGVLYVALMAVVEYRTDPRVQLAAFYLPAIVAVGWYLGAEAGIAVACLAALVSTGVGWWSPFPDPDPQAALWSSITKLLFFLFAAVMASLAARQRHRLENLAREDPLTGIPNRRAFFEELARALEWGRRHYTPWVLAYVDVDDFKQINDREGHAEGDLVLRTAARALRDGTRRVDLVARLGGDEFVLLLPETDARQAERVIEHVLVLLRERMTGLGGDGRGGKKPVTFSTGVVTFTVSPASPDTAVALADACMYEVKQRGKNGVEFRRWP